MGNKYTYKVSPIEKIYNRCETRIKKMCNTVSYQTGCHTQNYGLKCVMQEARLKFFSEFDLFENDEQYLKFLFIALKNKMSNLRSKETNIKSKYVAPLITSEESDSDPYMTGLNQLKDETTEEVEEGYYHNMSTQFEVKQIIDQLEDEVDQMIVVCIISGKNIVQTSRELKIPRKDIESRLNSNILQTINDNRAKHVVCERVIEIPAEYCYQR